MREKNRNNIFKQTLATLLAAAMVMTSSPVTTLAVNIQEKDSVKIEVLDYSTEDPSDYIEIALGKDPTKTDEANKIEAMAKGGVLIFFAYPTEEYEITRIYTKVHDDLTDTLIDVPVKAGEFEHEYILEDIKDDSRVIYVETNKKASETEIGDGTEAASEEQISEEKPAEEKAEEEAPAEEKPAEEMQL